jgi:hypothetical protein
MFVSGNKFSGPLACAADVLQRDGLLGFMKGGPQGAALFLPFYPN